MANKMMTYNNMPSQATPCQAKGLETVRKTDNTQTNHLIKFKGHAKPSQTEPSKASQEGGTTNTYYGSGLTLKAASPLVIYKSKAMANKMMTYNNIKAALLLMNYKSGIAVDDLKRHCRR